MTNQDRTKLLIVEDQDEVPKLLRIALAGLKYEVVDASTGTEALAVARRLRPAVMLLDILLPGELNGFEVCERIKFNHDTHDTFVILISGMSAEDNFQEAMRVGANAYLVKPFRLASLERVITNRDHLQNTFTLIRSLDEFSESHSVHSHSWHSALA